MVTEIVRRNFPRKKSELRQLVFYAVKGVDRVRRNYLRPVSPTETLLDYSQSLLRRNTKIRFRGNTHMRVGSLKSKRTYA
jgi:hypothetical protein|tara:strand:+ start:272 stop:511 length:240 start_codon:yes stop_codon:yes gene_type:complete